MTDCQGHKLVLMQQVREDRDLQLPCSYHAATMQLPCSYHTATMQLPYSYHTAAMHAADMQLPCMQLQRSNHAATMLCCAVWLHDCVVCYACRCQCAWGLHVQGCLASGTA
jgi:hypothetical protein